MKFINNYKDTLTARILRIKQNLDRAHTAYVFSKKLKIPDSIASLVTVLLNTFCDCLSETIAISVYDSFFRNQRNFYSFIVFYCLDRGVLALDSSTPNVLKTIQEKSLPLTYKFVDFFKIHCQISFAT